jgi:hypothetical protein
MNRETEQLTKGKEVELKIEKEIDIEPLLDFDKFYNDGPGLDGISSQLGKTIKSLNTNVEFVELSGLERRNLFYFLYGLQEAFDKCK